MKQAGMLELPVLGLLKEREMHGYELRKQLSTMLGPFWQVSWGSLYPALRRLARDGVVEKVADAPAGKSGKTLVSARRRTVYRVTGAGEALFTQLLEEMPGTVDAEHFTLKLAFFRYLQPEARLMLLERRRAYLQDKLAIFKENLRNYRERIDGYALSLQDHEVRTTESDIAWINELITKELNPKSARGRSSGEPGPARPKTTNA